MIPGIHALSELPIRLYHHSPLFPSVVDCCASDYSVGSSRRRRRKRTTTTTKGKIGLGGPIAMCEVRSHSSPKMTALISKRTMISPASTKKRYGMHV